MAVQTQRISSIQQARARRLALPQYLRIDGGRYLLGLMAILCIVSLMVLAQTGVVATKGYEIAALQDQQIMLMRERTQLQARQATAQNLDRIRRRAEQLGLRPISEDQVRYLTIMLPPAADEPMAESGE